MPSEIIEIDGSYLEGGGQILRTAIALSAVTGKPCRIFNIRAGRCNPGLQAQHAAGVNAVGRICNAKITGNEKGSQELSFWPQKITGGALEINIGTAGAISLVLQSLMIAGIHCDKPLDIKITGGTAVRWSPTIGYVQHVTLPLLKRFGYNGELKVIRHGFYPKGGGLVEMKISKSTIMPMEIVKRGKAMQVGCSCIASTGLKQQKVAERMAKVVKDRLFKEFGIKPETEINYVDTSSPGCSIDIWVLYENSLIGANAIGERDKTAEKVAKEALENLMAADRAGAPLDENMEDQIIPYLALAGSGKISVPHMTKHTKTNIWVVEKFLPVKFEIDEKAKTISLFKN